MTSARWPRTVYVVIPDNDGDKARQHVTVRPTPVRSMHVAGPERKCAMLRADLYPEAAREIAWWVAESAQAGLDGARR